MEDKVVKGQSSGILKSRSEVEVSEVLESTLVAEKRRSDGGCEGRSESGRKKMKLRDLEAVLRSEDLSMEGSKQANLETSKGLKWDLNAKEETIPNSLNKNSKRLKVTAEDSECGSTTGTGSLLKRDPMKVWKEMKENGFLSSSSHGGIPIPKPRGASKNSKSDMIIKQKIELAKKEQVDRFAKIAAPSGLLNGLNPGIINHVRNSKQVHSIIEALVQSEKQQAARSKNDNQQEQLSVEDTDVETNSETDQEPTNSTEVSYDLSVKAADVASQWLDLLHQDIKGRLAALLRSRKRVRDVITTELPLLISTELSDHDNNSAHQARWNGLFNEMDRSLSNEELKLEIWLKQVEEMQHHNAGIDSSSVDSPNNEKELAIRAAAASIYSTCNFLRSMEENQPCF